MSSTRSSRLPEVADSVVVHLQDRDGGSGERILLIVLQDGVRLDKAVRSKIAGELRADLSPSHLPTRSKPCRRSRAH